jgi:hypothetical protein
MEIQPKIAIQPIKAIQAIKTIQTIKAKALKTEVQSLKTLAIISYFIGF